MLKQNQHAINKRYVKKFNSRWDERNPFNGLASNPNNNNDNTNLLSSKNVRSVKALIWVTENS